MNNVDVFEYSSFHFASSQFKVFPTIQLYYNTSPRCVSCWQLSDFAHHHCQLSLLRNFAHCLKIFHGVVFFAITSPFVLFSSLNSGDPVQFFSSEKMVFLRMFRSVSLNCWVSSFSHSTFVFAFLLKSVFDIFKSITAFISFIFFPSLVMNFLTVETQNRMF